MSRFTVELDDDLVERAMTALGARTKRDALERALRRAVADQARKELSAEIAAAGLTAAERDTLREEAWRR